MADSDEDNETLEQPREYLRPRRGAICAEPSLVQGYFKEPFWNKHEKWETRLREVLKDKAVMQDVGLNVRERLIRSMSTHLYKDKDCIASQGEYVDALYVVLEGSVESYYDPKIDSQRLKQEQKNREKWGELKDQDKELFFQQEVKARHLQNTYSIGGLIDEIGVVWRLPRPATHYARGEQVIVAKLTRQDFMNLVVRSKVNTWWKRQDRLRKVGLLEMMENEQIAKLVDVLKLRKYEPGENLIRQGDAGYEFFIMASGEAKVWAKVGDDEQEYIRYYGGELFGEVALLNDKPRAATVTAVTRTEVLVLSRSQVERVIGPMKELNQTQYLTDPRKLIADFYQPSDSRGPLGCVPTPDPARGESKWFAVYRPTSKDAIAKMLSGSAVGKGLNVKGKSAKQGVLSGFVPFVQISDNKHKTMLENSPKGARLKLFFKTKAGKEEASVKMQNVLKSGSIKPNDIENRVLIDCRDYEPKAYGMDVPEPLLRQAYLMDQDLSPVMGWETGRRSEPAFMDMNLHAVRDDTEPKVVLFQWDDGDPMNPRGLLIAYAEEFVKPVVSDFDTFLVASKGVEYDPVPDDQMKIVGWMLEQAENILMTPDHNPWTVRWLDVIKKEGERGFHPKTPKNGFGDPTSDRFVGGIIQTTKDCGAIRHGAECFNYYFPQELDEEYLIVWEGFPQKPWAYKDEKGMRGFLIERMEQDHYCFPMNPLWPVRDEGWWEIWEKNLEMCPQKNVSSWYSKKQRIQERMAEIHERCPNGFIQSADVGQATKPKPSPAKDSPAKQQSHSTEDNRIAQPDEKPAKAPGIGRRIMKMFTGK